MKMMGIVFSNIEDESLGQLTKNRTTASVPFGGRYRLIDFILSNMVNSSISTVAVITKYNYQSLMDHLGTSSEWGLNGKSGGLFILPPFGTGHTNVYRGKIEALHGVSEFIEKRNCEYVLFSNSNILCNIDFQPALKEHVKSGADITVIANREQASQSNHKDLVLKLDEQGAVSEVLVNSHYENDMLCSMGMFIVKKSYLLDMLKESVVRGYYDLEKDFIQRKFLQDEIKINAYEFHDTVLRVDSMNSYYENNLKLLDEEAQRMLFSSKRPIYTKVRDEVPTHYGESAEVNDCLVADGCRIHGDVDRSILFRDVTIGKGSTVRNSIIMQGTSIGEGVVIENAIIDKDVRISDQVTLIGVEASPVMIKKGERL